MTEFDSDNATIMQVERIAHSPLAMRVVELKKNIFMHNEYERGEDSRMHDIRALGNILLNSGADADVYNAMTGGSPPLNVFDSNWINVNY